MSTQTHTIDLPNGGEAAFRILEYNRDSDGMTTARRLTTIPRARHMVPARPERVGWWPLDNHTMTNRKADRGYSLARQNGIARKPRT